MQDIIFLRIIPPVLMATIAIYVVGFKIRYETLEGVCLEKKFTPEYETINPGFPEGHIRRKTCYLDSWTIKARSATDRNSPPIEAKCTQDEWDKIEIGHSVLISRERGTKYYTAEFKQ